jgi:hypothetical protein
VQPKLARLAVPTRLTSGQVVPYGFGLSTREFLGHPMRSFARRIKDWAA